MVPGRNEMTIDAIQVHRLGKRYRLGEYQSIQSLQETASAALHRVVRTRTPVDYLWSLREISFSVPEGGTLGVIGRNGAGKSTLLKILSRITEPSEGYSRTRGRVAALLEVGTGFHPELTGRENVFLNGAILGMSRRAMERRFDEIVDFAGVERFVDTPVKRYSSGMYLRLAFAVAAHLEPDILIVDEVLAVGDAEFQAKCLRRMETAEREGRTVVFVSHNLDAVSRLCVDAVWLERGTIARIGPTSEVIDAYLTAQVEQSTQGSFAESNDAVSLHYVRATDSEGKARTAFRRDRSFVVEMAFTVHVPVPGLDTAIFLSTMRGVDVLNEAWSDTASTRASKPGRYLARLEIPPVLAAGEYVIGVWVGSAYETLIHEVTAQRIRLDGIAQRKKRVIQLGLSWDVDTCPSATAVPTDIPSNGAADDHGPPELSGPA
jgi:ABC-type polysaccharide/polyol phosphate transport system ATPase subunit